jgi:hypothetical protein
LITFFSKSPGELKNAAGVKEKWLTLVKFYSGAKTIAIIYH